MRLGAPLAEPLFEDRDHRHRADRLLDRARRADGRTPPARSSSADATRDVLARAQALGLGRCRRRDSRREAARGRRSGHPLRAGRRRRGDRRRDRAGAASRARSSRTSARSSRRSSRRRAAAARQASHLVPGASCRRDRTIRPRRWLRHPVRATAGASSRRREGRDARARSSEVRGVLGGARLECRDHDAGASRPRAGDHQPCAASHRLQHRRHRGRSRGSDALGGDQVLRRRLPRFHPHRRFRPDDVARRVPAQQGGGAGDARPLQRRSDRAADG